MLFQAPNQQCQSTEGNNIHENHIIKSTSDTIKQSDSRPTV